MMELTILGCHAATPKEGKHTTSQLLEVQGHLFLIDCGEATQIQLRKSKVRFSRIRHIFISHLHGDHSYGLIGLISTFRLLGRTAPLHIYGPQGIKEIITLQLKLAQSWTDYPLHFHELSMTHSEIIFEDDLITIKTLPLDHRIYTNGFLFETKRGLRKINKSKATDFKLEPYHFQDLRHGKDITLKDGTLVKNEALTLNPKPILQYAFCSDTAYLPELVDLIKGVDLLYHEATFLERHADLARHTKHSTAKQAATIAQEAKVKQLLLGHFSTRYNSHEDFLHEAQTVFENVLLAKDLKSITVS